MKIINQLNAITLIFLVSTVVVQAQINSEDEAQQKITVISNKIASNPDDARLYSSRGDLYFLIHDFDNAVKDYTRAIKLDDKLDAAWFGRGMARGRQGFIEEGIADLTVYINRHPDDSRAHTKRGVRYLWLGEKENARQDLQTAIKLNPDNAEAHDDLGVILAQMGNYKKAIEHFRTTVRLDPSYQKGHHNLAMALYITSNDALALISVNNSLKLKPQARNSLLLKSKILTAMGKLNEAKQIQEDAMFLPEENWHESAPVK